MTKFTLILAAAAIATSSPALAAPIVGLYNTGVMSGGAEWGVGGGVTSGVVVEPHWTMNTFSGTAPSGAWNSGVAGSFPLNGPWANEDATSRWVTPTSNAADTFDPVSTGLYIFRLAIDLTGFDASTATLTGRFLSDNQVRSLGIIETGVSVGSGTGFGSGSWTNFSFAPGYFVSGINTIQFEVENIALPRGNPLGLRVEFLTSNVAVVPEPATWGMMILGFGAIGGAMRRRKASAVRLTYA